MIIYVIIYHIRNNKNYSIDMSIKYNTIITEIILTIISAFSAAERKKITLYKCILLNPTIRRKRKEYSI